MDVERMQHLADLIAADLQLAPASYSTAIVPSPTHHQLEEFKARGIPTTSEFPVDWMHFEGCDGEGDGPRSSVHSYTGWDDPRRPPIYVREKAELAIAIARNGEVVQTIEFPPQEHKDIDLWNTVDQALESILEWETGNWPMCPITGHPHVVDLFEDRDGRLAWQCPTDSRFIALLGRLAEVTPRDKES
jgi:hypothetical protein